MEQSSAGESEEDGPQPDARAQHPRHSAVLLDDEAGYIVIRRLSAT
jgi:hypothetical protein